MRWCTTLTRLRKRGKRASLSTHSWQMEREYGILIVSFIVFPEGVEPNRLNQDLAFYSLNYEDMQSGE